MLTISFIYARVFSRKKIIPYRSLASKYLFRLGRERKCREEIFGLAAGGNGDWERTRPDLHLWGTPQGGTGAVRAATERSCRAGGDADGARTGAPGREHPALPIKG